MLLQGVQAARDLGKPAQIHVAGDQFAQSPAGRQPSFGLFEVRQGLRAHLS